MSCVCFFSSSIRMENPRRTMSSSWRHCRMPSPLSLTAWRATTCVDAASPTTALCSPSSSPSTTCTHSCWKYSTSWMKREVSHVCMCFRPISIWYQRARTALNIGAKPHLLFNIKPLIIENENNIHMVSLSVSEVFSVCPENHLNINKWNIWFLLLNSFKFNLHFAKWGNHLVKKNYIQRGW